MTLEEIKEQVAKEKGFSFFGQISDRLVWSSQFEELEKHHDEIAERYAQSKTETIKHLAGVNSELKKKTQELQEQNAELVRLLEDMETAWQSLPYGHNSVRDTQNWISNIIHPQILRMREWVYKHKTKHNHLNKKP